MAGIIAPLFTFVDTSVYPWLNRRETD